MICTADLVEWRSIRNEEVRYAVTALVSTRID